MAIEKGYYADENLDIETIIGGGQINTVQVVLAGGADVGIGGVEPLISGRARAGDLKVIGAMEQKSAGALTCMPKANIKTVQDLMGKKLGASAPQRPGLETLLKVNNITPEQVEIVTTGTDLAPLLAGQVDCRVTYATNEPITMRLQGIDPTVLLNYDLGLPQQGDPIFVTGATYTAKQEALVRFVRATMRGWAYAIANPDETVDTIIGKFGENLDRPQQVEALKAFAVLVDTDFSKQNGLLALNRPTWESSAQVMLDQGKLDAAFDVDSLLAPTIQEQAKKAP
jgi:NitT/TauT family transport system substrate-binding protein